MAQIRGTAGYNLGSSQNRFGVAPGYSNMKAEASNDPSPLDAIREQTSKIEDWLDTLSEPVKPYVYFFRPRGVMVVEVENVMRKGHGSNLEIFALYRYLPAIGRFLIVVTFLEDALRIVTQWNDQLLYLHDYRHCAYSLSPESYICQNLAH